MALADICGISNSSYMRDRQFTESDFQSEMRTASGNFEDNYRLAVPPFSNVRLSVVWVILQNFLIPIFLRPRSLVKVWPNCRRPAMRMALKSTLTTAPQRWDSAFRVASYWPSILVRPVANTLVPSRWRKWWKSTITCWERWLAVRPIVCTGTVCCRRNVVCTSCAINNVFRWRQPVRLWQILRTNIREPVWAWAWCWPVTTNGLVCLRRANSGRQKLIIHLLFS